MIISKKSLWLAANVLAATIAVAAFVCGGCSQKPKDDFRIKVGYKANSGFQNFLIAQERDLFAKHGIQVEGITFESTDLMMQSLALG